MPPPLLLLLVEEEEDDDVVVAILPAEGGGVGIVLYVHKVDWAGKQMIDNRDQRNEKISNKSSFGIIDIADSSTTDRIIVIVKMACFIRDGAW